MEKSFKKYAVIVTGGSGKRMGTDVPKQFIELNKKPILMHTISAFFNFDAALNIILVLPKSQIEIWGKLCEKHNFNIKHTIVEGGKERFHSVKNGLLAIDDTNSIVGIHDGVRPFVSKKTLERCYKTAYEKGNATPVIDVFDSIRKVSNSCSEAKNRKNYKIVQTPQCFDTKQILEAFNQEFSDSFTDDASVFEAFGKTINLVEGNRENIKITTPFDLKIGEALV